MTARSGNVSLLLRARPGNLPDDDISFRQRFHARFPVVLDTKGLAMWMQTQRVSAGDAATERFPFNFENGTGLETLNDAIRESKEGVTVHLAEGFDKYAPQANAVYHEAGYDAYLTGSVFASLAHAIAKINPNQGPGEGKEEKEKEGHIDFGALPLANVLPLFRGIWNFSLAPSVDHPLITDKGVPLLVSDFPPIISQPELDACSEGFSVLWKWIDAKQAFCIVLEEAAAEGAVAAITRKCNQAGWRVSLVAELLANPPTSRNSNGSKGNGRRGKEISVGACLALTAASFLAGGLAAALFLNRGGKTG